MSDQKEQPVNRGTAHDPFVVAGFSIDGNDASNPKRLLHAVNESAHAVRNGWVFFLALTAFFFVTVAGVTHKDLLLNSPVALPILQVGIALKRFFLFAPLILVLVHFAVLLQYAMLARKTRALHSFLREKEKPGIFRTHPLRLELSSYFFVQALAGPTRSPILGTFLTAMSWLTLGLFPVALLLFIQVAFLPFHDAVITWFHRIYLVADCLIILSIGIFTRFPDRGFWSALGGYLTKHSVMFLVTLIGWLAALAFSFGVATIPGYWMEKQAMAIAGPLGWNTTVPYIQEGIDGEQGAAQGQQVSKKSTRQAFWPTAYLFEGVPNRISGKATSWFSRNILVTDMDLVPYLDKDREDANEVSLHLRGRDLTYAYFDRSDLHRADLTGAKLDFASMSETNLSHARMRSARLTGVNLERANLAHADLSLVKFYNANLKNTGMQCANLYFATIIGSDLSNAKLPGSNLHYATLQASNLGQADLQGSNMVFASLQLSDFLKVNLQGANLSGANLTGANLSEARLQGADMGLTTILGTNFALAQIWQTKPPLDTRIRLQNHATISFQSLDSSEETKHYIDSSCQNDFDRTNHVIAKQRLSDLLDGQKVSVWANSIQHSLWKSPSSRDDQDSRKKRKVDYTNALVGLACASSKNSTLLARRVITMGGMANFAGERVLLRTKLSAKDCLAGKNISVELLAKLNKTGK
ncbi:MAG: pentapeptide repeat-containing protein [bacterium]|nr:pentapeptide repeat-containing protein [bacterium]